MAEEFDNKTENTSAQSNGGGREGYRSNDYQGGGYRSNGGRTMRPRIGGAQRAYSTNRSYDNNNDGGFRPEGFGAGLQHDNNGGGYQQRGGQGGFRPRYNQGGDNGGYQQRGGLGGYRPRDAE